MNNGFLPPVQPNVSVVGLAILPGTQIAFAQPTNPDAVIAGIAAVLMGQGEPSAREATNRALELLAHAQCAMEAGEAGKIATRVRGEWGLTGPSDEDDAIEAEKRRLARLEREGLNAAQGPTLVG